MPHGDRALGYPFLPEAMRNWRASVVIPFLRNVRRNSEDFVSVVARLRQCLCDIREEIGGWDAYELEVLRVGAPAYKHIELAKSKDTFDTALHDVFDAQRLGLVDGQRLLYATTPLKFRKRVLR